MTGEPPPLSLPPGEEYAQDNSIQIKRIFFGMVFATLFSQE